MSFWKSVGAIVLGVILSNIILGILRILLMFMFATKGGGVA